MKKRKQYSKMITALILALVLTAAVPLKANASSGSGKYVSEVYVAYGEDADHARDTLQRKGFTPVEGNLNDGGKTFVMMGYKTTNNIRDSITDLAAMNMHGDFSVEDYKTLLKAQKTEIAEFLTEFMTVIREYRANLKAGKAKAVYVQKILNSYIDDDTGMKMGDLLNSETLQDRVGIMESIEDKNPEKLPNLVTILLQGNSQVIRSIEVLLSVTTDTAENSWVDRFAEMDYDTLLDKVEEERPELNTETKRQQYLDNIYGDDAAVLGIDVVTLSNRLKDYEAIELKVDTATEEEIKSSFGDIEKDGEALLHYQNWLSIGMIYDSLEKYEGGKYKKGELLDFFLEEHDPEDIETFIPLAAALSEGQRYGLPFVGLELLLRFAFATDEGWKQFIDENKANIDGLQEVSVYQNIDRDLYKEDGSVALTGSARRANNTAAGTTGTKSDQLDTLATITVISWAATFGSVVATLISTRISDAMVKDFAYNGFTGEWIESLEKVIFNDKAYEEFAREYTTRLGGFEQIIKAQKTRFAVKVSQVFQTITVFLIVASAFMTILELERDKSVEQLPIPNYLVDNYTDADGGSYALNYKAVECNREAYFGADYKVQKGSCADIMADEGKQWLVLYASKNSKAGRPLTPNFVVQNSSQAPAGYEGMVHLFGEKGAVNIASSAFREYSTLSTLWQAVAGDKTVYVFSKLSTDIKTYDESAGNMRASSLSTGQAAIIGFGGLALGAVLGATGMVLARKRKKKEVAA